jgi:hypothetical protein
LEVVVIVSCLFLRILGSSQLGYGATCEYKTLFSCKNLLQRHYEAYSLGDNEEDEGLRVTGKKLLVSPAPERACTLVVGGQKVTCEAQCDGFGASAMLS